MKEIGKTYLFEYHCLESHDSVDAILWYHTHQRATILNSIDSDEIPVWKVRFSLTGLEYDVFDDELLFETDP